VRSCRLTCVSPRSAHPIPAIATTHTAKASFSQHHSKKQCGGGERDDKLDQMINLTSQQSPAHRRWATSNECASSRSRCGAMQPGVLQHDVARGCARLRDVVRHVCCSVTRHRVHQQTGGGETPGLLECHCRKHPSAWRGFLQLEHQ